MKNIKNELENLASLVVESETLSNLNKHDTNLLKLVLSDYYDEYIEAEKDIINYQNEVATDYDDDIDSFYLEVYVTINEYIVNNIDSDYVYC